MVLSTISDWPKVSTRSLKVPMMVKGRPVSLMTLPDGGLRRAVDFDRHFFGDDADFVVSLRILLNRKICRRERPGCALAGIRDRRRESETSFSLPLPTGTRSESWTTGEAATMPGTSSLHGLQIVDGERVGVGVADVRRAAQIFRPDLVGADGLNLVEDVLPSGHADGDDKDERGGADDHAQRGQHEAHFVAAESVVGEGENLAQGPYWAATGDRTRVTAVPCLIRCYVGRAKQTRYV